MGARRDLSWHPGRPLGQRPCAPVASSAALSSSRREATKSSLWGLLGWPAFRFSLGGSVAPAFRFISREGRYVKAKVRLFVFGIVLGALAAFPLGVNLGRDAPLLSNPFTEQDLTEQVVERVKSKTTTALEDARETIHDATKPLANKMK